MKKRIIAFIATALVMALLPLKLSSADYYKAVISGPAQASLSDTLVCTVSLEDINASGLIGVDLVIGFDASALVPITDSFGSSGFPAGWKIEKEFKSGKIIVKAYDEATPPTVLSSGNPSFTVSFNVAPSFEGSSVTVSAGSVSGTDTALKAHNGAGSSLTTEIKEVDLVYDVNGDGKTDVLDMIALKNTAGVYAPQFDYNRDKSVNDADILLLQSKIFGD